MRLGAPVSWRRSTRPLAGACASACAPQSTLLGSIRDLLGAKIAGHARRAAHEGDDQVYRSLGQHEDVADPDQEEVQGLEAEDFDVGHER
mmetsp:Transcript_84184/g.136448  ORF Transcript_84184/g.136448 Transcript_84184/m.136448 type:complete len:90 (+) Transcript_84184:270-539(+)